MRKTILATIFAAGVSLAGANEPVQAQGITVGPGGVQIDPYGPRREYRDHIGRREATEIARDQGMAEVFSVDRDAGEHRVRGEDRRGRRMPVVIDAHSGRVLDVVRRD